MNAKIKILIILFFSLAIANFLGYFIFYRKFYGYSIDLPILFFSTVLLFIIIALSVFLSLHHYFIKPIKDLYDCFQHIDKNHLSEVVSTKDHKDEVSSLNKASLKMQKRLKETFDDLTRNLEEIEKKNKDL